MMMRTRDQEGAIAPRPSPTMTVKECAAFLHISPATVYRLLKTGKLPAFRVGSDWRFNVESIDAWRLRNIGKGSKA
jgi:excisionase family DNA binding protein